MTEDLTFADLQAQRLAVVDLEVDRPESTSSLLRPAFEEVVQVAASQGLQLTGPPVARYVPSTGSCRVVAGFPVSAEVQPAGRVHPAVQPAGHVALTTHAGPYDGLAGVHAKLLDYALENGYESAVDWWERYLDTPEVPMPRTEMLVYCRRVHPRPTSPGTEAAVPVH